MKLKEKILLDTNMLIYILDDHILDEKIINLTKMLYDSDKYMIVIHPRTLEEANKLKDENRKSIFKSKLKLYNKIDKPPKITEEFNNLVGCKNNNDKIDNEMLYAVYKNCVSFFITNDKELLKKASKLNLGERVLSIDEAIHKFKSEEKVMIDTPVFINEEYLYNLDLEEEFFTSLRKDYFKFDDWFEKKQREGCKAYITRMKNNKLGAFLMLKEEDKNEDYSSFKTPFNPGNRMKVSTFKVSDTGKKIGECFIKIMINEALRKKIDEIYVTTFERQEALICLLEQYGFKYYTYKITTKSDNSTEKELIYVKNLKNKNSYPYIKVINQNIFIVPVQPRYHKLLFEEAEKEFQISINDTLGKNTSSNAIRKAFISNSKIKDIKEGDILLFYASHDKKAITTLGVVDTTWNKFNSLDEIFNIVSKRTAYNKNELYQVSRLDSLVIMFKHYITFNNPITDKFLYNNRILNGPPQSIGRITKENFRKIVMEGKNQNMIEIL